MGPGKVKVAQTMIGRRSARWRRGAGVAVACATLLAVLVVLWGTEDTVDVAVLEAATPAPIVSVVEVVAGDAVATVSRFAEVRPRWDAEVRTVVSGRITRVHDSALAGSRVAAGTPLFSIEKTRYASAVAAAETNLEQARLALWRAKNDVVLARREFALLGTEPPNSLALRLPQRRIAERTLAAADAELQVARRELAETEVRAPFSGLVTRRTASLGQTVAAGEALLQLTDDRSFEIVVELDATEWELLAHPLPGRTAELFSRDGRALGRAEVRGGGGFLDPETRQRRIFLEVAAPPDDLLLAGAFVRVDLPGRTLTETLTIPESAVSRRGFLWLVDPDDRLVRYEPRILFRASGALTIAPPEGEGPWRVALHPLLSFLPGQRVAPAPGTQGG